MFGRRATHALVVIVATLAGAITSTAVAAVPARPADQTTGEPGDTLRVATANIKSGMSAERFAADLKRVTDQRPDFISVNEANNRTDAELTPLGYAMWRTPGQYTGATPVLWRTDRWNLMSSGTEMISNREGYFGRQSEWGKRRANWVVLRSNEGRTVSMISVHFAPAKATGMEGITGPSTTRLGELATRLAGHGPVMIGGDLNVHYSEAGYYPQALLAKYQLRPSFDTVGTKFATHDGGGIIDYLLQRDNYEVQIKQHFSMELNSDHDAVLADYTFLQPADGPRFRPSTMTYTAGTTRNRVPGTVQQQRRVATRFVKTADRVPPGGGLHVATTRLRADGLASALVRARERGVNVRLVITGGGPRSRAEARVRRALGTDTTKRSYATRCRLECELIRKRRGMGLTTLLASRAGRTNAVRLDANRPAGPRWVAKGTVAKTTVTQASYDRAFRGIRRLSH